MKKALLLFLAIALLLSACATAGIKKQEKKTPINDSNEIEVALVKVPPGKGG